MSLYNVYTVLDTEPVVIDTLYAATMEAANDQAHALHGAGAWCEWVCEAAEVER